MATMTLFLHAANAYMYLVSVDGTQENERWLPKSWCDLSLLEKGRQVTPVVGGWSHGRPTVKYVPAVVEDVPATDTSPATTRVVSPAVEAVGPASYEFQVDDYLAAHLK